MAATSLRRNVTYLLALAMLGTLSCALAAPAHTSVWPGAEVTMSHKWELNSGWLVECSWKLNESLSTVKLFEDGRPFKIYKPEEKNMSETHPRVDYKMKLHCFVVSKGMEGSCVILIELYQPQSRTYHYSCEVSGRSPMFRQKNASIFIPPFVPPTDAVIEVISENKETGRVCLTCRSSGVPPPCLVWTVGGQTVPDCTEHSLNATSKLNDVGSVRCDIYENLPVICTPEIKWDDKANKGASAAYSCAHIVVNWISLVVALSTSVLLLI